MIIKNLCVRALMIMVLGLCSLAQQASAGERIAVLVSASDPPFEEALAGFQGYLAKQGIEADLDVHRLAGDGAGTEQVVQNIRESGPRMIFALGSLGTEAAIRKAGNIPLIACLILRQNILKNAANATGVVLEFPLETQFTWLQNMLPDAKTIGVIYNPIENRERIEAAQRLASSRGLKLAAQEVRTPQEVPAALNILSRRADVLWGLTDNLALSPQIAKHIILFSFRNTIPLIGPSAAWAKAGALYSLDWDYLDLGSQCGEMAVLVLEGTSPSAIPPTTPRKILYSVNRKTAQQMKIPISQQIMDGARFIY